MIASYFFFEQKSMESKKKKKKKKKLVERSCAQFILLKTGEEGVGVVE